MNWLRRFWTWLLRRETVAAVAIVREESSVIQRHMTDEEIAGARRLHQWCANHVGKGYAEPPSEAAPGYFWKLDRGALDGVGGRRWRLYHV